MVRDFFTRFSYACSSVDHAQHRLAVDALDQIGVTQAWWDASRTREVFEFLFTAGFLRAGIEKSGPVAPVVK